MKIIQSATILFSTRGVRNTTVDEIKRQLKLVKVLFIITIQIKLKYYVTAICVIFSSNAHNYLIYIKKKKMFYLEYKILHYISLEYHQDPFVSTLFQEYKEYHSPEITTCFKQSEEEAINMISNLLEKGYQQGALHKVPLPLTAFMLVRMIFNYEQDYIKNDKSDTEFLQLLKHMLLKTSFNNKK